MAQRTTSYRITGDASQFASAMQDAAGAAEQMEGALGSLESNIEAATQGALQFDEAVGRFRDASGQFVSGADAQQAALSELRDEGIRTEQQIQDQIQRLEALREVKGDDAVATQELTDRISSLRAEMNQAEAAIEQSEQAARALQQGFSSGVAATGDLAQRQDMLQQELRATAAAEERVTNAGVTMRSSVGASANNLAFEMTQAAQDMQFGLAGVANQIPLMSEQFTQLKAKADGTRGAMSELLDTFMGPTGLLAAGTLLIQMWPQIADFFTSTAQSAREATDAYKSAAEEIFALEEVDLPGIDGVRELRRRQDFYEEAVASIEQQRREITAAQFGPFGRLTGGQTRLLSRLETRGDRYQAILSKINEQLRLRRTEMQQILDVQGDLLRQVDVVEPENQIIEFDMPDLDASFGDLLPDAIGLHARLNDALKEGEEVWESYKDTLETVEFGGETMGLLEALSIQERWNEAMQNSIDRMLRVHDLQRQMRAFGIPTTRQTRAAAGALGLPFGVGGQLSPSQAREMPAREGARSGELGTTLQEQLQEDIEQGSRELARDFGRVGGGDDPGTPTVLESVRLSLTNLQDQFDLSEQEARQFKSEAQSQISQVIQTAGQLGATLARAFQQGEVSAQQMVATAISGIGSILSATGNPIAGAVLGGVSNIIGSFRHGGTMDSPVANVHSPEIIHSPAGTEIIAQDKTKQILEQAAQPMDTSALEERMARVEQAIRTMKIAVPVRETKHKMVEDDLAQGQKTGNTLVANIDQL